ncbi:MAG: TetR/AcrR family transcriptional regulator [Acidobacteria bacterium]|nr:TetR/AcrR family transcriptional regulator [Acidobacteriota bacterium]
MRAPKLSRADRRKAIVDTAAQLFAEVGFRGGTTRELARRVGVTEPVLYEHFQTKRDLYSAIIDDSSVDDFAEARLRLERKAAECNPRDFFKYFANSVAEHFSANPNYLRLILFSALEKHDLAELCFERHAKVAHQIVTNFIKGHIKTGAFRKTDAALAARAFMGMVMHYMIFDQHFGFKLLRSSRKRSIDAMVDIFLSGLKANESSS